MSRILDTIEGEPVTLEDDGSITFKAKAAIDGDGAGASHGDPDFQAQTSLRHKDGSYLNADTERYIALSPDIMKGVAPVVLGSQVHLKNALNDKECDAVVGDIGPHRKLGEISIACAKALGINPSPTRGGEDRHAVLYTIYPGVPAVVDGIEYDLQHL